jgi:transcription elongation factor Elf1
VQTVKKTLRRLPVPKFINSKGTQILICELCRAIEFEEAFVDEGLTYILICQNCGAHHIADINEISRMSPKKTLDKVSGKG